MSFKAMWNNKCPKCRHGKIFTEPFQFTDPLAMPKQCEFCGQVTEPEPGFYYGAMFISYILSVWFLLLPTLLLVFYFKWSATGAISFSIFLAVLTYMKFLRGSRSFWLHLMVRHDPKTEQAVQAKREELRTKDWKPNLDKISKTKSSG